MRSESSVLNRLSEISKRKRRLQKHRRKYLDLRSKVHLSLVDLLGTRSSYYEERIKDITDELYFLKIYQTALRWIIRGRK